jgi:aspartyl-tRNA(Asn)/glutamyl-tRNA(Gln) amidotransferase subunit C
MSTPPIRIDDEAVRHVAGLSGLALTPAEIRHLRGQLGRILEYVAQLDQVDTQGVEPTTHPLPSRNVLRPDVPGRPMDASQTLQNTAHTERGHFLVPPLLERDESAP